MAYRIQIRRDTATNWQNNNPVLAQGEFGYELDTGKLKIGDGTHNWNDLPYFVTSGGATGAAGTAGSIQYNDGNGGFAGNSNLVWDTSNTSLKIDSTSVSNLPVNVGDLTINSGRQLVATLTSNQPISELKISTTSTATTVSALVHLFITSDNFATFSYNTGNIAAIATSANTGKTQIENFLTITKSAIGINDTAPATFLSVVGSDNSQALLKGDTFDISIGKAALTGNTDYTNIKLGVWTSKDKLVFGTSFTEIKSTTSDVTQQTVQTDTGLLFHDANDKHLKWYDGSTVHDLCFAGVTSAGTTGSVQYNDGNGGFAGDNYLVWDATNHQLKIDSSSLSNNTNPDLLINSSKEITVSISTSANINEIDIKAGSSGVAGFKFYDGTATTGSIWADSTSLALTHQQYVKLGAWALTIASNKQIGFFSVPSYDIHLKDPSNTRKVVLQNTNLDFVIGNNNLTSTTDYANIGFGIYQSLSKVYNGYATEIATADVSSQTPQSNTGFLYHDANDHHLKWKSTSGTYDLCELTPPTTPGGSDKYVQYNANGQFAGDGSFIFDYTTIPKSLQLIQTWDVSQQNYGYGLLRVSPSVTLPNQTNSSYIRGESHELTVTGEGTSTTNDKSIVNGWYQAFAKGSGSLTGSLIDILANYGIYGTTENITLDKIAGIYITPYVQSGTVNNVYGLYLNNISTGGTYTNYYPIYQADSTGKNIFNAQTVVGGSVAKGNFTVIGTSVVSSDSAEFVVGKAAVSTGGDNANSFFYVNGTNQNIYAGLPIDIVNRIDSTPPAPADTTYDRLYNYRHNLYLILNGGMTYRLGLLTTQDFNEDEAIPYVSQSQGKLLVGPQLKKITNGGIGINATAPVLEATTSVSNLGYLQSSDQTSSYFQITNTYTSATIEFGHADSQCYIASTKKLTFTDSTIASGDPRDPLLAIDVINKRVGINTNTPSVELSVAGSGLITGNLTVNGNIKYGNAFRSTAKVAVAANSSHWYKVAISGSSGGKNSGLFLIEWEESGYHGHKLVYIGANFNDENNFGVTVLSADYYSSDNFTNIRILSDDSNTYALMYLDFYFSNPTTSTATFWVYQYTTGKDGWNMTTIVEQDTLPSGYTAYEFPIAGVLWYTKHGQNKPTSIVGDTFTTGTVRILSNYVSAAGHNGVTTTFDCVSADGTKNYTINVENGLITSVTSSTRS